MQPAEINDLYAEQGSTFDQPFKVLGDNGLPVDLTTFNIRGQVRKKYSDTNPTLTFRFDTTPAGLLTGDFNSHLTAAQLADTAKGSYVYDVEIYYNTTDLVPEEIVYKVAKGSFIIGPEVTKPVVP